MELTPEQKDKLRIPEATQLIAYNDVDNTFVYECIDPDWITSRVWIVQITGDMADVSYYSSSNQREVKL